jgi:nicotinate-nucleotide adenylyltransferase|tara:strand:+ start:500 stop:1072 length:573 start_codon:yes stop_codon:yes gene_type:complete
MNIGLYFGTFNPVHNGHISIAKSVLNYSKVDKLWLVLTPQSPHKTKSRLIDFKHRYEMLKIACEKCENILPIDIEENLPSPNYSIDTLKYLKKEYNSHNFSLVTGSDNMQKFTSWKDYNKIVENHKIYVYPRGNCLSNFTHENINYLKAPYINISASKIRKDIVNNQIDNLKIDPWVFKYIVDNNIEINI